MMRAWGRKFGFALTVTAGALLPVSPASSQAIQNPIAIFAGLDKITGRITTFEIPVDEVRRFGALNVYPRICNSRPPTEEPKTTSFVQIDENLLNGGVRRIFSGWMLAESPGLNGVEHPVFDVWLVGCRDPNRKDDVDEEPTPAAPDTAPEAQNDDNSDNTGDDNSGDATQTDQ